VGKSPPPDVQSLASPQWLRDLIADFPNRLLQYQAQVESERQESLRERSQVTAATRAKIAAEAFNHIGREEWRKKAIRVYEGPRGPETYWPGDNKCNLFVYEMLTQAGARVEMEVRNNGFGIQIGYPPLAGKHWADPSHAIPGFEVLKVPPDSPQPGDVAAIKKASWDATGHVGIVVGPPQSPAGMTVSGRADGVVHNKWGFEDKQKGEVVFRRYVGWPEDRGAVSEHDTSIKTSGVAHETVPPVPEKPRERNRCAAPGSRNAK
jgi:hypothetical protein